MWNYTMKKAYIASFLAYNRLWETPKVIKVGIDLNRTYPFSLPSTKNG